jgi:hypothetical protein
LGCAAYVKTICLLGQRAPDQEVISRKRDADTLTCEVWPFRTRSRSSSNVIVALIPISGYYEWQDTPGAKHPWYFKPRDGSPRSTTQSAVILRQGVNCAAFSPEVQCNVRFSAFISLAGSQSIHGH